MTAAELLTAAKKFTRKQCSDIATLRKKYAASHHMKVIYELTGYNDLNTAIDMAIGIGMAIGMDYLLDYLMELTGGEADDGN